MLHFSLSRKFQNFGLCCGSTWENVRCRGRTNAVGKQGDEKDQRMGDQDSATLVSVSRDMKMKRGCCAIMDHAKWPKRYDTNILTFSTRNNCRKCVACHGIGL